MIAETLKADIKKAMFAKDQLTKDILRVALGDIQTQAATHPDFTDADAQKILRKILKSNNETIKLTTDQATKDKLAKENVILNTYLPQNLSPEKIAELLKPLSEKIRDAGNTGQAMGIAMKTLKATGQPIDAKDVSAEITKIRG